MEKYKTFTLENGLQYIIADIPNSKSSTISIMIKTGSIYENKNIRGGAHLLEHLLFKGNKLYPDQFELTQKLDSMGARFNAYTDTNMVSFHIKIRNEYVSEAIIILGDMIATSLIGIKELKEEKYVVIQELEKDYDEPARYINDLLIQSVYKGCNYSYPVGGTIKSVKKIDRDILKSFWKSNYNSNNIVISIAGNINILEIRNSILNSSFVTKLKKNKINNYLGIPKIQEKPRRIYEIRKNMSQVQLSIAFPTFSIHNESKYSLELLKIILAGPMSSRLFQILRSKYGLAYYIGGNLSLNESCGDFALHTGVDATNIFSGKIIEPDKGEKSDPLTIILDEVFKLTKEKVTIKELNIAKEYLRGNIILDSEDSETISQFYGKQKIIGLKITSIDEYIDKLINITIDDIFETAKEIFKPDKVNIALVGEFDKDKLDKFCLDIIKKYN